ncbi:MAG: redoxin domain-containing protein [Bacteroidales bacterium]|nr:redoxin domain-containing protein [Bacteroidales bacterium]
MTTMNKNSSEKYVLKYGGKIALICITALLLITSACKQSGNRNLSDMSADSTGAKFIPNPQIVEKQDVKTLEIGAQAPEFSLPDVNGDFISLDDFSDAEVLVILFICNHCPTAQAYEDRIISFTDDYKNKNVSVVAIMPNSNAGLLLEECGYSDLDDSYEAMGIRYKYKGYNFPYLYDGDNEAVSIQYGPVATPHAFVFDKDRKLQYVGRLDASEKPGTANAEDLRNAVDEILSGKPVTTPVNKAFGCSVKWSWKSEWTDKVNSDWNAQEVTLQDADINKVKDILANNTEKLRLVNIWATWCAPCVIEYPEFVNIHRMYYNRDFEFVSISADKPEQKEKTLKFLQEKHSALQNYIYSKEDKYELIEAVDPEWGGALPYTLLIEPGGNIIYKNQGIVDLLELKRKIVEHKLIGRVY